jgi:drug/metabolite transporter (DMT)-like permease
MEPFNLLAIRFLIAFSILVLIFPKEVLKITKKVLVSGFIVGTLFFVTMTMEMLALEQANSSLVSLLENCAIIYVPMLEVIFFRRFPNRIAAISIATAMVGVALWLYSKRTLRGFNLDLLAGLSYALAMIATDKRHMKMILP